VPNPWLKKNPFISMWLSGANPMANSARGQIGAEVKRQSTAAADKHFSDMFATWTKALTATSATERKRKG